MLTMLMLLVLLATPLATKAWERGKVETFATLPPGEAHPEGIAVDREGNVYVATVAVNKPKTSEGTLLVFDPQGKHLRTVGIKGSSRLLLDIGFHPQTGKLLVVDYKAGKVLSVDPKTGASSVFMTVTGKNPGLNGMTFDAAGNVYVTDAHQGIIWKVGPDGGEASAWVTSPLLKPTRIPPSIGANGLAFNNKKTALFVANTANDIIVKIPVTGSTLEPGTPEVFVNRVGGGPDGLHHRRARQPLDRVQPVQRDSRARADAGPGDRQARRLRRHRPRRGTHRLSLVEQPSSSTVTTFLSPTCRSISDGHFAAC